VYRLLLLLLLLMMMMMMGESRAWKSSMVL
jgi:hypothetical protein